MDNDNNKKTGTLPMKIGDINSLRSVVNLSLSRLEYEGKISEKEKQEFLVKLDEAVAADNGSLGLEILFALRNLE